MCIHTYFLALAYTRGLTLDRLDNTLLNQPKEFHFPHQFLRFSVLATPNAIEFQFTLAASRPCIAT